MGMVIWKYELRIVASDDKSFYPEVIGSNTVIWMPRGAKILSIQIQDIRDVKLVSMWALVDPTHGHVKRSIQIYGTGHPIERVGEYIGTFQIPKHLLVFHAFDMGEEPLYDPIR